MSLVKETHDPRFIVIAYKFVFSLAVLTLQPWLRQFHAVNWVFAVTANEIFVEFVSHLIQFFVVAVEFGGTINQYTISWNISELLKRSGIPFSCRCNNQFWMSKNFLFFINIKLFPKHAFIRISLLNIFSCEVPNVSVLISNYNVVFERAKIANNSSNSVTNLNYYTIFAMKEVVVSSFDYFALNKNVYFEQHT
jgi:hypothetical protein